MKITIDTKEDSHEEIKRMIKMLSSLVGEKEVISNEDMFSDSTQQTASNDGDMFSDDKPKQDTGMFNMFSSSGSETKEEDNEEQEENEEIKVEAKEAVDLDLTDLEEYDD